MKYTPKQYAEALYQLLKEHPHQKEKTIKEFSASLLSNDDMKHTDEILRQFGELVDKKEGKQKAKEEIVANGGIRVRIGDTVVDNTISERIKQLKTVIGQ